MKGQTLIEVLIALSIAVVVITAITWLSISSLNNAQSSRNQDQATKYAQEGMELVRKIRNSSYTTFAGYNGTYCLPKGQTTFSAQGSCTTPNIDTTFIRSVQINANTGCGVGLSRVVVTVSWSDNKCTSGAYCRKSELVSCFSTQNPVTAP
jgi:prepilin-type N-terminal cleavage/methylation domain-containing protein